MNRELIIGTGVLLEILFLLFVYKACFKGGNN